METLILKTHQKTKMRRIQKKKPILKTGQQTKVQPRTWERIPWMTIQKT